jgi:hypothetical protein
MATRGLANRTSRQCRSCLLAASVCVSIAIAVAAYYSADAAASCASSPPWISGVQIPSAKGSVSACFAMGSDQAEALVSIANTRDYAQSITVAGTHIDFEESVLPEWTALGERLHELASDAGREVIILGPYAHATLAIDRPPPETAAQRVTVSAMLGPLSALSGRAWSFLSAARAQVFADARLQRCMAPALVIAATTSATVAELHEMAACVTRLASPDSHNGRLLRGLVAALLRDSSFQRASALEEREPRVSGLAFTIPSARFGPVDPQIHITPDDLGTLVDAHSTVERLTANGGSPPYRYYLWSEAGEPEVPSWVTLTPGGTLTIRPPRGFEAALTLNVYAIDANGYASEDLP